MSKESNVIITPKGELVEWQKREGEIAASSLLQIMNEQTGQQRKVYSVEWEQHEMFSQILMRSSKDARDLIKNITAMKTSENNLVKTSNIVRSDPVLDHQMDIMNGMSTDRFSFRSAPYDVVWTDFQPSGAKGTAAHGPSADINGHMSLDLTETYVDRPVAYGGWMRNAAGVGTWFKPKSTSTYVRVAPFTPYEYRWKDDSSLQVAHNSGDLGVFIQRFLGPGQFETIIDNSPQLWRDGTGWYETHQDDQSGYFTDSNYFWASSNDWYLVWIWCRSGIDFATKTTFGSSRADNHLVASLKWLVFEQWA